MVGYCFSHWAICYVVSSTCNDFMCSRFRDDFMCLCYSTVTFYSCRYKSIISIVLWQFCIGGVWSFRTCGSDWGFTIVILFEKIHIHIIFLVTGILYPIGTYVLFKMINEISIYRCLSKIYPINWTISWIIIVFPFLFLNYIKRYFFSPSIRSVIIFLHICWCRSWVDAMASIFLLL